MKRKEGKTKDERFFVALLPPQETQDCATEIIQTLSDRHHTGVSKAPPHITLQPPFERSLSEQSALTECLSIFASQHKAVPLTLSGFGSFAPRVLYINVLKTPELMALQADLSKTLEIQLAIARPQNHRPFAPHLTVASRNVTRTAFEQAWAELQPRSIEFNFESDRLTLLIHDGQQWRIAQDFPFFSGTAGLNR